MTSRFKFRLEALETMREKLEENAKNHYAQTLRAREEALQDLRNLDHELELCFLERSDLKRYFLSESRILYLKKSIANQKKIVESQERRVAHALQNYLRTRRDLEVVRKLKERDLVKYKKEVKRKEFKELDYIYTSRTPMRKPS